MVKPVLGSTLKFAQTGKFHRKLSSVENPPLASMGVVQNCIYALAEILRFGRRFSKFFGRIYFVFFYIS